MPRPKKSSALKFYGLSLSGCGGRIAGTCHVNIHIHINISNVADFADLG
jgi:hypothetical protein